MQLISCKYRATVILEYPPGSYTLTASDPHQLRGYPRPNRRFALTKPEKVMLEDSAASGFGGQGNREWLFDWCPYVPESPSEKANFDVAMIECWKYDDDDPSKKYELGGFHTETMSSWLKEPTPTRNERQPTAGFKVAVVPCAESSQLPYLTNGEIQEFNAAFGLPYFQKHYSSIDCGACGMFLQPDNSYGI